MSKFFQVCKAAQDKKPRDVFDVQGQRLQGTEAEGNLNSLRRENSNDLGMTMTNWKSQHDQVSDQRCLGSGGIGSAGFPNIPLNWLELSSASAGNSRRQKEEQSRAASIRLRERRNIRGKEKIETPVACCKIFIYHSTLFHRLKCIPSWF